MQYIRCDVATSCVGQCASMAAVLLAAGAPGKRFALPNSRDPHPPAVGRHAGPGHRHRDPGQGDAPDARRASTTILAKHTGQPVEKIHADTERDNIMTAEEAKAYGLVDAVFAHRDKT